MRSDFVSLCLLDSCCMVNSSDGDLKFIDIEC